MKRRTYLSGLGGSIGVTGVAFGGLYMPGGQSTEPPSGARRRISLVDSGSVPDESPLEFELTVEDPWVTPSSTATLRATTRNVSDCMHRVQPAFYKGTSEMYGEPGIIVYNLKANDFRIEEYKPPCFGDSVSDKHISTSGAGDKEDVLFTAELDLGEEIAPGDSRTEKLIVADDPTVDGCFPPNRYQFESKHTIDGATVAWNWEIDVETL